MSLENLPEPIKEHILKCINGESYEPMPNAYSLTELLGCVRQTFLKKMYEQKHDGKSKPFELNSCFAFYRGKLFDAEWTKLFKRNQIRCTYTCQNIPITISGHFDFMYENAVWDLKTTKNLYFVKEPSESYCKQVNFYAYCNSLNKGYLLYVDMGGCKVFPIDVSNRKVVVEEIEEKAEELYKALNNIYCEYCNHYLGTDFNIRDGDKCPSCSKHTYGKYIAPVKPVFSKSEAWHCDPKYCQYYKECQDPCYGSQTKLVL